MITCTDSDPQIHYNVRTNCSPIPIEAQEITGELVSFKFRSLLFSGVFLAVFFAGNTHAVEDDSTTQELPAGFEWIKIDGPEPLYPRNASVRGQQGWVDLRLTVAPDGVVEDVMIVDAEPKRVFERAAVRAATKWVFKAPSDWGITESISHVYRVRFIVN